VIRAQASQELDLTVTAGASPAAGNVSVDIEGHEGDPVSSNNRAMVSTQSRWRTDLAVTVPTGTTMVRTQTSTVDIAVNNQGPDAAPASRLTLQVASGLSAISATASAGSCTVTGSVVECDLGNLATNASATAHLVLRGEALGTATVGVLATADGIDVDDDQTATAYVQVTPLADVAVELAAAAGGKVAGTPYDYTATVRNNGPDAAPVHTSLTVTGATVAAATSPGGSCTVGGSSASCTLNALASGASTTITYRVTAASAGNVSADTSASVDGSDSAPTNNAANLTVSVAAPPSSSGGGGGGGGRFDVLALGLLGLLLAARQGVSAKSSRAPARR